MAAPTYKTRALVLRKTKLSEKDLIITFLNERGALIRAVAKGARKPGGSHAAKLELFSVIEGVFSKGRSLDIIGECKLLAQGTATTLSLEQAAVATPVAELLSIIAQEDLEQPRLFDLSVATFERMRNARDTSLLTLCAAALWKILSQAGFRPNLMSCVICGDPLDLSSKEEASASSHEALKHAPLSSKSTLLFSLIDGGVVCTACGSSSDVIRIDANLIAWCNYLIQERFPQIEANPLEFSGAFAVLSLARSWAHAHINREIKSLDFLFSSGLFEML